MARIAENLSNLLEYFGVKSRSYYHSCPEISYDPDDPLAYYLDQIQRAEFGGALDESGVPLYPFEGQQAHLPVHLVPYALGNLERYRKTNDEASLGRFRACAEWLTENQQPGGAWVMPIPSRRFGLEAPWRSGMAQGLGISCLVRAATVFDEPRYLESAVQALALFKLEADQGGVATYHEAGPFYEEYTCQPRRHVLNGFIFAMWGLYDLVRHGCSDDAKALWDGGLKTLIAWLPKYDLGHWSLYHIPDRPRNPATLPYHRLHVRQLTVMHMITGQEIFEEYAEKWNGYLKGRLNALRTLPSKAIWLMRKA